MKEQLIFFETAKLAKEKGFNWPVNRFFDEDDNICPTFDSDYYEYANFNGFKLSCPTQSLLQKWLREKYNIQLFIFKQISCCWSWTIWGESASTCLDRFDTYEQALEKGLQEALKLI